ncbi:MAG: hypothetical protein QOH10_710, partial [Actinomycetota bacterium]|nr:hypothetical protein [Actinomycetota bacterium]
ATLRTAGERKPVTSRGGRTRHGNGGAGMLPLVTRQA